MNKCPDCAAVETLQIVKEYCTSTRSAAIPSELDKYPLCKKAGLRFARTEWHGAYGWQHVIDAAEVEALLKKPLADFILESGK